MSLFYIAYFFFRLILGMLMQQTVDFYYAFVGYVISVWPMHHTYQHRPFIPELHITGLRLRFNK